MNPPTCHKVCSELMEQGVCSVPVGRSLSRTSGTKSCSDLCKTKGQDTWCLPTGDRRFLGMGGSGGPGKPNQSGVGFRPHPLERFQKPPGPPRPQKSTISGWPSIFTLARRRPLLLWQWPYRAIKNAKMHCFSPTGDLRFWGLGGPGAPGKPNQSGGGFAPHSLEGLPKPPGPPRPPKTSAQDEPSGSRTLVETVGSKFSPTHCGETCGDNIGENIGETFGENFHAFLSHTFINFGGGNWWVKVSTTSLGRSPTPMFHQASRSALQGSSAVRPCEGARQLGLARQLGPARELGSTALQTLYI